MLQPVRENGSMACLDSACEVQQAGAGAGAGADAGPHLVQALGGDRAHHFGQAPVAQVLRQGKHLEEFHRTTQTNKPTKVTNN